MSSYCGDPTVKLFSLLFNNWNVATVANSSVKVNDFKKKNLLLELLSELNGVCTFLIIFFHLFKEIIFWKLLTDQICCFQINSLWIHQTFSAKVEANKGAWFIPLKLLPDTVSWPCSREVNSWSWHVALNTKIFSWSQLAS